MLSDPFISLVNVLQGFFLFILKTQVFWIRVRAGLYLLFIVF